MSMGLDPLRAVRAGGIDQYRAGLGEYLGAVASDAWANGPLSQATRVLIASDAQSIAAESGETMLSAQEASDEGRELGLRFDAPIARGAYNVLADEKRRQAAAEATFRRARLEGGYGTLHWLLAGGTEFLVQAADPLNIASAFIPVIGEARAAAWAARVGGFGAALGKGAVEGVVGQALLEPLSWADRRAQGADYGINDTLTSLAFGAGLGVALHGAAYGAGAGFRFIRDRFEPRERAAPALTEPVAPEARPAAIDTPAFERAAEPPPRQPVAERMETLRPETKDAALRTAVAQLAQDKPVDIEPVLAADPSWPKVKAAIEDLQAHQALQAEAAAATPLPAHEPPADFKPTPQELAQARRVVRGLDPETPLPTPERLSEFVRRIGGLTEGTPEAGDLLAAEPKQRGLIRPKGEGRQFDHLAVAAHEAGYRVGETREGVGVDAHGFLDLLIEDATGHRAHFPQDAHTEAWRAQQQFFDDYRRYVKEGLGLDPRGMDPRQLAWLLRQDESTGRLLSLAAQIDRLGDHASLELAMRLEDERVRLQEEIVREPGVDLEDTAVDHREMPAVPLQELERYHAEFERAAGPGEARQEPVGAEPAAGRTGEGGEAGAARPARDRAASESAGLRREGGEGAEGTAGAADDINLEVEAPARGLIAGEPAVRPVRVRADAIAPRDATMPELRRAARQHYATYLTGTSVVNEATGREIGFDGSGWQKTKGGRGEDLLRLVPALPELLRAATPLGPPEPDRLGRPQIRAEHKFRAVVDLDGNVFPVVLRVRERLDGSFYYSISKERPGDGSAGRGGLPAPEDHGGASGSSVKEHPSSGQDNIGSAPSAVNPDDLARFAERQQSADLHADPDALGLRDERLAGEARETAQLLQDDLRDYGALLDDDARLLLEETGRIFDDEAKAIGALASCRLGGNG